MKSRKDIARALPYAAGALLCLVAWAFARDIGFLAVLAVVFLLSAAQEFMRSRSNAAAPQSKKPRLGDIVEIKTPKGLAYLQYANKGTLGDFVRILPGFFETRPRTFKELAKTKELYFTFYQVTAPALRDIVSVVANEKIPRWARRIPVLRRQGGISREGKALNWWIINGDESCQVNTLTPEQENLSVEQSWSHGLLVHRLVQGWLPKDEGKGRPPGSPARPTSQADEEPLTQQVLHYLYFPKREFAEKAAAKIRPLNYKVEVLPGADDENWLVLVDQAVEDKSEISEARDKLEALAQELKGDYDGFEIEVVPQTQPPRVN
jgi:hypothetical protein